MNSVVCHGDAIHDNARRIRETRDSVTRWGEFYLITPEAGSYGVIEPSTPQEVRRGGSQRFDFLPDPGYNIQDVVVFSTGNTIHLGSIPYYIFENVQSNRGIIVIFTGSTPTPTPTPGSGPVPDFTYSQVTNGATQYTYQFTDASTGNPTRWFWEFGDGTSSRMQNPLPHSYTEAKTYTVRLTATNSVGQNTISQSVNVVSSIPTPTPTPTQPPSNVPSANFTTTATEGAIPLTIGFIDTSTGSPTSWHWDFGEGSAGSTQQNPLYTYTTAYSTSIWHVTLIATNSYGSTTKTKDITTYYPYPVAVNTPSVTSGSAPLTVSFTGGSSGAPGTYSWDFGDGTRAYVQNPTHTYTSAGTYIARFNITDSYGTSSSPTTITVNPTSLNAGFTSDISSGIAPLTVRFNDTSTGNPTSWNWSFGDSTEWINTTSSAQKYQSHTYVTFGTYTVKLVVTNALGSSFASQTITVTNTTLPIITDPVYYTTPGNYVYVVPAGVTVLNITMVGAGGGGGGGNFNLVGSTEYYNGGGGGYAGQIVNSSLTISPGSSLPITVGSRGLGRYGQANPLPGIDGTSGGNSIIGNNYINASGGSGGAGAAVGLGSHPDGYDGQDGFDTTINQATSGYSGGSYAGGAGGSGRGAGGGGAAGSVGATTLGGNGADGYFLIQPILLPPVANFSANITSGNAPLTIQFNDTSLNNRTRWNWSFGDNTFSPLQNPIHPYHLAGNYTVSLNAINPSWSNITRKIHYIVVLPPLPVASFTANQTFGSAPFTVKFTDMSQNSPTAWEWDFGDGEISQLRNPVHTYSLSGTYDVKLNATNAEGSNILTKAGYIKVDPVLSTVPIKIIPAGATVYIGESALNLTACMGTGKTLAWFQPGTPGTSVTPDQTIDITGQEHAFSIAPSAFSDYQGTWYNWRTGNTLGNATTALQVFDPEIDLIVWDTTMGADVDGRTIPVGNDIEFRIETNLGNMTERGIPGAPVKITITDPRGNTYSSLTNKYGNVTPLGLTIPMPSYSTGPIWDTENSLYQMGKYTISAGSSANQMQIYYPVPGRSFTQNRTINLSLTAVVGTYPPTFTAIAPTSAYRNNTAAFSITGTNFQTNGTVVEFRNQTSGLIPATLTTITPTRINGTIAIPAGTVAGSWNIRIRTSNGGENTKLNAFTISAIPAPVITSITPASGFRNSTVGFTIVGTGFEPGLTTVKILNVTAQGMELPVTGLNVTATQIKGAVFIPDDAIAGNFYRLNIATSDGGLASKATAFTVNKVLVPTIISITPATGIRNSSLNFTIAGTNFQPGLTGVKLLNITAPGTELPVTVFNVTTVQITGRVAIPEDAIIGTFYRLNITTGDGGLVSKPSAFAVTRWPAPTISTISPASYARNATFNFTITGTNFRDGYTNVSLVNTFFGIPLYTTLTSVTPTSISGAVTLPGDITPGSYDLIVTTTDGGTATKEGGFTVNQLPIPTITSITPVTGSRNTTVSFTIVGSNFEPNNATTVRITPSQGLPITAVLDSVSGTTINGRFAIPPNATGGLYRLDVATIGGGENSKTNAFTVTTQPAPTITSISPVSGYRNTTVSFMITGTNFEPDGKTFVRLYLSTGSTINTTLDRVESTKINGSFFIPADATTGVYRIDVLTVDGGSGSKLNAFTVNAFPAPTITSISPASGYRNTTVNITIVGTYYQPGLTSVKLLNITAPGMELPLTVLNVTSTQITGYLLLPANANPGNFYRCNITTGDGGFVSKTTAFTVNKQPLPAITSITPAAGYKNSTVSYTIAGTGFQPGLTSVNLSLPAYGELETTVYAVTTTQIIGGVRIPSAAPAGAWKLNATTVDGGTGSKASAFTISKIPLPAITTFTPVSGYRGTTLSFVIDGTYFQTGGRTTVKLSRPGASDIPATLTSVYSNRITGMVLPPSDAATGYWKINVTTLDGGEGTKANAISLL